MYIHLLRTDKGFYGYLRLKGLRQLYPKNKKFNIYYQFGDGIGPIAEDINHEIWLLGYRLYEPVNRFQIQSCNRKCLSVSQDIFRIRGHLLFAG